MSNETLVQYCAPTLVGLKTGSLFACNYQSKEELYADIRRINRSLKSKGLVMMPLKTDQGRCLIYLFRPASLMNDLSELKTRDVLDYYGYSGSIYQCISLLSRRIAGCDEFPHEIGLFLGYPVNDVIGFIENKGKNYKAIGQWKVYDDLDSALMKFESYNTCTRIMMENLKRGKSLEMLAVRL